MKRLLSPTLVTFALAISAAAAAQPAPAKPTPAPAPPAKPEPDIEVEPIGKTKPPTTEELAARLKELLGRPGGLTASAVAKRTIAKNPGMKARQARLEAVSEQETQAIIGMVPRLTLTARYTRLSPITPPSFGPSSGGGFVGTAQSEGLVPPGSPLFVIPSDLFKFPVVLDNYLLQASIFVPISDIPLRALRAYRAAKHEQRAADIDIEVQQRNVELQSRAAYWDWVRISMDRVVAEQTLAQSQVQLDTTKALEEGGKASRADVLQAQARVEQAKLLVDRAKNAASSAEGRLRTLMHDDSKAPYEIGEDPTETASTPALRPLPELYADAVSKRPEIRGLDEQSRTLVEQREQVRAGFYPQLSAFADFIYANPNPRFFPQQAEWHGSWDVGVQLTWSPNDVPAALSSSNTIDARRREVEARRDELVEAIENDVRESDQGLRDALAGLEHTEQGVVAAEEAYRVRVERYRYGRGTLIELADAETALLRARLERVGAQVGVRVAMARLQHALGN
jgi:outer membrane protein